MTNTIGKKKLPVTVIIAAKNEAANICKCIQALEPAQKIYLIDSQSDDKTVAIAEKYGVETIQYYYKGGYPKKRQWAISHLKINTDWIFLIDADEVVPPELWEEINVHLVELKEQSADAYLIKKGFHFMGKKFRFGGFSHKAVLLFRKGKARFESIVFDAANYLDMEVHERLIIDGKISALQTPLIHEDFKGLTAYIQRHNQYSSWEARVRTRFLNEGIHGKQTIQPRIFGNVQEQRRFLKGIIIRMPFEPLCWFLFHYFLKLGCLEGKRGLIASRIRSSYIAQTRAKMYEIQLCENLITSDVPGNQRQFNAEIVTAEI